MPSASKKYKLHSTTNAETGEKPICAFFTSEAGCRNGANCKFSHGAAPSFSPASQQHREMVVSSESSESESESSPFVSKQEFSKHVKASTPPTTKKEDVQQEDVDYGVKVENSYASLANPKRKRKNSDGNMFAKPKNATKIAKHNSDVDLGVPVEHSSSNKSKGSSFRMRAMKLDLPIAPFTALAPSSDKPSEPQQEIVTRATTPKAAEKPETPPRALPTSTAVGKKWLAVVQQTQSHRRYSTDYNFIKYRNQDDSIGYASNTWVQTTPFHRSKADHPQVIAIDCEMCESKDPVSGKKDNRALCRVSVVDAETDEVLLDTLVKPTWPVSDHRDWVNGITADDLTKVQFTLRHAQAFMMELCTEETVIVGHAVQNDLAALRIEHYCVADSALLYKAVDSENATVALRDLATTILKSQMPKTHDSVNDARVAFACVDYFRKNEGNVEAVVRTPKPQLMNGREQENGNRRPAAQQLFVHRIPEKHCKESDLATMFLEHTSIKCEEVDEIVFNPNGQGKTHIHFTSRFHAELAFNTLQGKAEVEKSGRLQKNVYLRNGNYIRVRMMTSIPSSD